MEFLVNALSGLFLLTALSFAIWLKQRRQLCWVRASEASLVLFNGALGTVLLGAHLLGAAATRLNPAWRPASSVQVLWVFGFPFDVRFYLMSTMAALLLLPALICLRVAAPISRNCALARRAARQAIWLQLALLLPLALFAHYSIYLLVPSLSACFLVELCWRRALRKKRLGRVVAKATAASSGH